MSKQERTSINTENQWYWHPSAQHITLKSIFQLKDKYCFLAGSGISLDPPSCLPTGYQFTRALLERIIPQEEHTNILALMDPEREGMRDSGDFLRFEQLMEYLQYSIDPHLGVLNNYAKCKSPNQNHLFLAQMLLQNHVVLTTNFDSLIEHALLKLGASRKQIKPIIYREDWQALSKAVLRILKRRKYRVYKLHGSLIDICYNTDTRDSLQATLAQITRGKGEALQLEPWKRELLSLIFQNHDVVVLGYSGLDDFDILPTMWAIPSPKRILWISHDSARPPTQARIEVVQTRNSPITPQSSSNSDRVGQNLLKFAQYQTRQPTQLFRIRVHTGQLLEWLWHRYVPLHQPIVSTTPCPNDIFSLPVQLKLSNSEKWFITGQIFINRYLPSQALQAYQNALALAQAEKNQNRQEMCLNNIGNLLVDQNQQKEAFRMYQQALNIAEQMNDLRGKATTLNNMGHLFYSENDIEMALEHYQQALNIAEQMNDLRGKAITLNNMGQLFLDQEHSLRRWNIIKTTPLQEDWVHSRVSRLPKTQRYKKLPKELFNKAFDHYQQAISIFEHLGDLWGKTPVLNNIGLLFHRQEDLEEALDYYQRALTISRRLGNLRGEAITLNNIGLLLHEQNRLEEALRVNQQALILTEQLGDSIGRSATLVNIGRI
ncbi:MAG: tetratricopeptide repeat protein, partial [Promethearchaeota archaeon]